MADSRNFDQIYNLLRAGDLNRLNESYGQGQWPSQETMELTLFAAAESCQVDAVSWLLEHYELFSRAGLCDAFVVARCSKRSSVEKLLRRKMKGAGLKRSDYEVSCYPHFKHWLNRGMIRFLRFLFPE